MTTTTTTNTMACAPINRFFTRTVCTRFQLLSRSTDASIYIFDSLFRRSSKLNRPPNRTRIDWGERCSRSNVRTVRLLLFLKISVIYTVQWCALCGETKERKITRHIVHFKISKQSDWIDCEAFSLALSDDVWGESAYVYEYDCLRIRWSPTTPMTTSHLLGNIALTSLSSFTKSDKSDANAECDTLYYSRHIVTLHPCEMWHHASTAS